MARSKYLDPTTLTRAERIVAVSAWLGALNALLPWWYRVVTVDGTVQRFNAGVDWTGIVAWVCFGGAGILILTKAWIWPEPVPRKDGSFYLILGVVALSALSVQSLTHDSSYWGFYAGVALSAGIGVGGALRRKERHAGWR